MDMLKKLHHRRQVVLAGAVLYRDLLVLRLAEVVHTSYGESMWHGVGFIAGLLLIAVLVWEGLRARERQRPVGDQLDDDHRRTVGSAAPVHAHPFLSKPGGGLADSIISRTIWLWIGLILAIVIVAGAWLNMQAAGESLADVKTKLSSMTSSARSGGDTSTTQTSPTHAIGALRPRPSRRRGETSGGDDRPAA